MAHLSEKSALRTHRMLDTARLRYSFFHLSCTLVKKFLSSNEVEKEIIK